MSISEEDADQQRPEAIQITAGHPTDEELAAAISVLSLALAPRPRPRAASDRAVVGGWNSYVRVMRREHYAGRGAWTARL